MVGGDYFCASHGRLIQGVIDNGGRHFAYLYLYRKEEENLERFVEAMRAFEKLYSI